MKTLAPLADHSLAGSPAQSFRRRRFARFLQTIDRCEKPQVRILDIGGTVSFWESVGFADSQHEIVLANIFPQDSPYENISTVVADARSLPQFDDNEFDVVFSNSVIEHLRNFADQQKMADEVRRLAPRYFVQTPNYYFPIEPHFLFPGFHYLPPWARVWLLMHFRLGTYQRVDDPRQAEELVGEIRLLTTAEFRALFPDAKISNERVLGLTKSLMAIKD